MQEEARGILHQRIVNLLAAEFHRRAKPLQGREIKWMNAFDREGKPIETLLQFCMMLEDREYCRLAETLTPTGFVVSTVWVGHQANFDRFVMDVTPGFDPGPPILFETAKFKEGMVLDNIEESGFEVLEQYTDELAAKIGHAAWVAEEHFKADKESDGREQADS